MTVPEHRLVTAPELFAGPFRERRTRRQQVRSIARRLGLAATARAVLSAAGRRRP